MKKIEIKDLKKGEIYKSIATGSNVIFLWTCLENGKFICSNRIIYHPSMSFGFFTQKYNSHNWRNVVEANDFEKYWITQSVCKNEYIPFSDILKSYTQNDKVLKQLNTYPEDTILKVESSEGEVYELGDKITVFTKNSPNKGKKLTIKSFRWNNAKTNICAVTELHTPNGIGLDKIELYVEPKVKIVDDFVLPEKWCIRLNLENVNIVGKWFNENSQTGIYDYHKLTLDRVSTVYNILHYPAYKYLGLTKHGDTINKIKNSYTEIKFEQFKKYVLNEKV